MIVYAAGKPEKLTALAKSSGVEYARLVSLSDFLLREYDLAGLLKLQYSPVPEDRPEIYLVNPDDKTRVVLKEASVGQKCTAMLLMALCEGSMPVIIDQPEDSLDNRTVWDDVCTKLRDHKEARQFILATHNSSLAVASDTDKYIVVEGTGAQTAKVALSGSVDVPAVKEQVINYLEGGKPTYLHKFAKYTFSKLATD